MADTGLDLSLLCEINRKKLVHILEEIHGTMDFVVDSDLMKPLDTYIQGASTLRRHGVKKIFKLSRETPAFGEKQRCFLTRPNLTKVKWFCDQARASVDSDRPGVYHLILSPRNTHAIQTLLEEEGLFGQVIVWELNPGLLTLDRDVFSIEIAELFRECFLEGDQVHLQPLARALCELQQIFGKIPNVFGHGRFAAKVRSMCDVMWADFNASKSRRVEIGSLFIFDRDVDYPAVLLTQLTYGGLLDEVFGVTCNVLEFKPDDQTAVKMVLSSENKVYSSLADLHFSSVGPSLAKMVRELTSKQASKDLSVQEMKRLVKEELKEMQAERKRVSDHVAASEIITKRKGSDFQSQLAAEHAFVEGADVRDAVNLLNCVICFKSDPLIPLRLLSLYSFCNNGLNSRDYRAFKTSYLHAFGFEKLKAFHNLKKLGLVTENNEPTNVMNLALGRGSGFRLMAKKLGLIPPETTNVDTNEPSYVFGGGYVPVTVKIVSEVLRNGKLGDELKWCPGESFSASGSVSELPASSGDASRVAVICFVGGVTFAEISAFRLLGRKLGKRFIIVTTGIINGNELMKTLGLFNFQSLLVIVLLLICTCTYIRGIWASLLDRNQTGLLGTFWKCARIGERKSPYVALCCFAMAATVLFWS
ncbi:unnamed protein product [Notodromas monacha]|uniref:Vacuolar protein sorting-associated protein 33B n=1 Tax=Notodromas monacha TaxID=399045 RepID=A0A7R9BJY3_9CRUS|nr:unnamed protein product [Notodromas monacha]CAG0915501.1 unnamed protein product [Notodromas monacha]